MDYSLFWTGLGIGMVGGMLGTSLAFLRWYDLSEKGDDAMSVKKIVVSTNKEGAEFTAESDYAGRITLTARWGQRDETTRILVDKEFLAEVFRELVRESIPVGER